MSRFTKYVGSVSFNIYRDLQSLDEDLPGQFHELAESLFVVVASVLIMGIVSPWIFLPLPFLGNLMLIVDLILVFGYYWAQKRFRTAVREIKRLDSISRSPVFQQFSEGIAGLETIR